MRVVSLVPSLTEAVTALGAADRLVGVTRYCTVGAPPHAARVGGTKNPSVPEILALEPDLVLANTEENRRREVDALRAAGVEVHVSFPRAVADVGPLLADLAARLGVPGAAAGLVSDLDRALAEAARRRPARAVRALTLIWRKPWMGVGPGTFVDDLLACCGFANVLADRDEPYPRLDRPPAAEVVLLPDEPYAFGPGDLPALRAWLGEADLRFVDGRLLTWHGPSTAAAVGHFTDLARTLRRR